MLDKTVVRLLLAMALLASAVSAYADVFNMPSGDTSLQFVTVGDPGNVANPATGGTLGSVGYTYQMGKYDVTVGQYCQFLNAVATTSDPYGLYSSGMATDLPTIHIIQNGSSPNYSYTVTGSNSQGINCPIFDVSWGDAARFCNWLDNGQPTSGTEAVGTTETGAYNLITSSGTGATTQTQLMAVPSPSHSGSNAPAYFLPTQNEWYKAAYYSGGGTNSAYYLYPTKSNTAPGNTLPDTGNNANFINSPFRPDYADPTNYLTPVGSFVLSPGPYGTFDMGGDVWQWNETDFSGSSRGFRGGQWDDYTSVALTSTYAPDNTNPTIKFSGYGFRVASIAAVPEPDSIALLLAGGFCLAAFAWRRRRKAA